MLDFDRFCGTNVTRDETSHFPSFHENWYIVLSKITETTVLYGGHRGRDW